jgi:hypothetical protein
MGTYQESSFASLDLWSFRLLRNRKGRRRIVSLGFLVGFFFDRLNFPEHGQPAFQILNGVVCRLGLRVSYFLNDRSHLGVLRLRP